MAAEKWLTVVVDGTAAMGPYWKSILSDYLEKIIRNICGQSSADQDASAGTAVYLGLVQYNSHGLGNTGCLMRASPWTRNMEGFLECLSALHFSGGGGLNEAAIAEGLAEALVMFPKPTPNGTGTGTGTETETCQVEDHYTRERHCILVAASNPMLTPTYIQIPMISNGQFSTGTETRLTLADAQDVAKLYAECSISLSLISPKQFPKLRDIYNATYTDDPEGTPSFSNANNTDVLVLLSKDFLEAHAALLQYAEVSRQLAYVASDLFEDNKDFEYVGDMMDLLETDEQDRRKGNIFNETREMLFFEHVAQYESLKQAPLIMSDSLVSDASHPCSARTVDLKFSDLPELFKDNCDFESVGDMLDLLETYEQNHRAGNIPDETREMILVEHDAQDDSLSQAPLSFTTDDEIMSGSFVSDSLPFSASTIHFFDLPVSFKVNNDFESVGDMLDLLDTYEKDHREENIPDETREMLLVEHIAQDDGLSQAPISSATSDMISSSLVSDASLPCSAASASTIKADLPSPQHAQQILTTHDMSGVHRSQESVEDPSSPQTTTSSDASATTPHNSRVPRASSRTRTSKISKSHFQPRTSPRISSRATVEQGHVGPFGRSGEPSSDASLSVQTRPPRKGSKHLAASTLWKEDVYELAWKGIMLAKHQGRLLLVGKAQAYKTMSAPKSLTAAWRRLLMRGEIIPQATVSGWSYQGQTNDLIFEIMDDPKIHNLLHEKELCIRYSMPTQSLIITPAVLNYFTGRVYAGEGASSTSGATSS